MSLPLLDPNRGTEFNNHQKGKWHKRFCKNEDRPKSSVALSWASPRLTPEGHREDRADNRGSKCLKGSDLVRPARLERATFWFVAVNTFVDMAQPTAQRTPKRAATWTPCWTQFDVQTTRDFRIQMTGPETGSVPLYLHLLREPDLLSSPTF